MTKISSSETVKSKLKRHTHTQDEILIKKQPEHLWYNKYIKVW